MRTKMYSRTLALLMIFAMVFGMLPGTSLPAYAADPQTQVNVIIENNSAFTVGEGAAWDGVLLNLWVDYSAGDSMMDSIGKALTATGKTAEGMAENYIDEIDGLAAFDGGGGSGWMCTVNDWFTNEGLGDSPASPGDQVRVQYTMDYGVDIGGFWGSSDTSLSGLSFDVGTMSTSFSSSTTEYTLTVPSGTSAVTVTPTALHKNYQVRTYLGSTYTAADLGYRRIESIPVSDGSVLTIVCGDPSWPSMNDQSTASVYHVTIEEEGESYDGYMKITIPENGTMTLGTKVRHYYPFTPATLIAGPISNTDNTVSYYYDLDNGKSYIYEMQVPGKAKYSGTFTMSAALLAGGMTVTDTQISASADYISYDMTANRYNISDIFINANAKGYLTLGASSSYQLHPLRNWQAVENTVTSTTTTIVEPNYHYKAYNLSASGITPSDGSVITVSDDGLIETVGAGTAIVLITYDALYENASLYSGTNGLFSAIWPENTGVIVVGVNQPASTIQTNMTINVDRNASSLSCKREGNNIDAEHDVLYYLSTEDGAKYTFTPEAGTSVTLLRPTVSSSAMTYSGNFSTEGVSADNGTYTLTLTSGRNIVRIVKGSEVTYQILTAKEVSALITNDTDPGAPFEPGDRVKVVFDTIYHPVNKLAAIYNFSAQARYTSESGSAVNGTSSQYQFASTAGCQTLTFTVPDDWEEETFSIEQGAFYITFYGAKIGSHRDIDWVNGHSASMTAIQMTAYMGVLPDITVNIGTPAAQEADTPVITQQPNNAKYFVGDTASALSVTATITDAGSLSYQWQSSTDNNTFADIDGATLSEYTPEISAAGTKYYQVIVTNTLSTSAKEVTSDVAAVRVEAVESTSVDVSLQQENYFIMIPQEIIVSSNLAEKYGYKDEVDGGVSIIDVLVRLHELMLEDDFTQGTSSAWLTTTSTGLVNKVFGEATIDFSFAINGHFPYDPDSEYSPSLGYSGYSFIQAMVEESDAVDFFYYQDYMSMDYYTWFEQNGSAVKEITVTAGEAFTMDIIGFMYMFGSYTVADMIEQSIYGPVEDAQLGTVAVSGAQTGQITDIPGAVTDEAGQVTLSFNTAGTYYVSAYTDYSDTYMYITSPWVKVIVEGAAEPETAKIVIEFEKDYYLKGDDVVAKVVVYGANAFDTAGYSIKYNGSIMSFDSVSVADGYNAVPFASKVDRNTSSIQRLLFADLGTKGHDGDVMDTIKFIMTANGKPTVEFVKVPGDADFSSREVQILIAGQPVPEVKGDVTYAIKVSEDMAAAAAVDQLIDAIGTVTLESGDAIAAARSAYEGLTPAQKNYVTKLAVLVDAEARYAELQKVAAADVVKELINNIGTVTPDSLGAIEAAREAYEALTAEQKQYVDNMDDLELAEAKYELWTQGDTNFDGIINAIDLSLLLSNYGESNKNCDLNGDGIVNATDLSTLLSGYGNQLSA